MTIKFLKPVTPYIAGDIVDITKQAKAQAFIDAGLAEEVVKEDEPKDTGSVDDTSETSGGDENVSPARKGKAVPKTSDK